MPLKPGYLLLAGAGGVVAYAGVKGWGLGGTFRDIISGQNPNTNPVLTAQITPGLSGAAGTAAYGYGTPGAASGSIAGIAESLIGFPYVWGGAPATGGTDCSGLVNWAVGKLGGRSIPGYRNGSYSGTTHGPNTLMWLAWLGTGITHIHQAEAQAGDLAIWQTHMGIIVDNGISMVSDLNPSLGTRKTTIAGAAPPGEVLVCARLK
jgi:cell wall-associated NlpC family hydrolase